MIEKLTPYLGALTQPNVQKLMLQITSVTAPSPKGEGFLELLLGHPVRRPKYFVRR
jgi:hypothetical protein